MTDEEAWLWVAQRLADLGPEITEATGFAVSTRFYVEPEHVAVWIGRAENIPGPPPRDWLAGTRFDDDRPL